MNRCWVRCAIVASVMLVAGAMKVRGQAETQGEKLQREEVQAQRDRQAQAASTQKAHEDNAAANQQRISDEAELKRLRATAPEREAAARSREAAERNARAADEEAYLRRASAQMDAAHIRDRQRAIDDLREHPIPTPAPGSVTECDSMVAAPYDETRPLGLDGISPDKVNAPAAVAACREQVAKEPTSARAKFELARALVISNRCDEAFPAIDTAIAAGSSAAAYLYGTLFQPKGSCYETPKTMTQEAALQRAFKMGNADAGLYLTDLAWPAILKLPEGDPRRHPMIESIQAILRKVLELTRARDEARDNHALYIQATIAQATGSQYFGYDSIYTLYQCVVRGYPLCKQFDRFR